MHPSLEKLPSEWPVDLLPLIQARLGELGRSMVVLDDDPTGTQTVYDIPVLTEWSIESLRAELARATPLFYILTNSRSLALPAAQALNQEIGQNICLAAEQIGRPVAVVSRSDSTLRGHYPGETDALMAALGGTFDATLIIPFFLEGGRYTLDNVHYVAEGDTLVPAAETPFARDAAFGYQHSNLCEWVEEKTAGRVRADQVATISLTDLRAGGPEAVTSKLNALNNAAICIVNCVSLRDMQVFVLGLLAAEAQGKRFLYRTAASFVQICAGLPTRPLLTAAAMGLPAQGGGLIVVGSYVPKSSEQLAELLKLPHLAHVEMNVEALLDDTRQPAELKRVAQAVNHALAHNEDVVFHTSRTLVAGQDATTSLAIGQRVSASVVAVVQALHHRPRYLLAKGGVTSSDVATKGLGIRRATVLGQILPGVPVWQAGAESRYPGLAYIVFPGNVGGEDALRTVVTTLAIKQ